MASGPHGTSLTWLVCATPVWGAALFGTLEIQHLPLSTPHSLCGPWGCYPPLSALLACHGFWLVFFTLPSVVCVRNLPRRTVRRIGLVVLASSGLALLGAAGWVYWSWYRLVSEWQQQYVLQRYIYTVVTLVEVPIVPSGLFGAFLLYAARPNDRPRADKPATA